MKKRRLALGAFTFASCSPYSPMNDAGVGDAGRVDAGLDAGYDAGLADAGSTLDAGCPCRRDGGACALPNDFPADASTLLVYDQCICNTNDYVFCYDETSERCPSWFCNPGKDADGGVSHQADGGLLCMC